MARPQRSVSAAVVAVVALAGLLAAGRWLQPRLDRPTPAATPSASPTVVTATHPSGSPASTKTADTALVDAIAVTPTGVWIAAGGLVLRIDPVTRRAVVPGIETAVPPVVELTAGAGAVWAATTAGRPLLRIDPRTARVAASLPVPTQAVAANRSGVWVRGTGELLWRIDPTSNRVVATVPLPSRATFRGDAGDTSEPGGDIAVTEDAVWVSDPAAATVWRIDPRHHQVDGTRLNLSETAMGAATPRERIR